MATEDIKKFIEVMKDKDIEELLYEAGDMRISLKRLEGECVAVAQPKPVSQGSGQSQIIEKKEKQNQVLVIKSPMVGTFLRAQSPDYPPLVMEGNHIVPGQKVGLVEAMKIMKDVVSSVKGKITKVLVDNGQTVEYGQELFHVDPETNSKGN
ncbi:MAG: hypothetical protein A2252_10285 [Elusimicrobia bacterium RIFOXYA2_FULL_39_19]|nr:MAG: hypothetical protein A2252_10285 [Elusimicrobia bacterium RIFOXYA2_FULL_39_19]